MGLKQSNPDIIHGSLLTYLELLLHAGMVSVMCFLLAWLSGTHDSPVHERDVLGHC